jgi:hypothetical protein
LSAGMEPTTPAMHWAITILGLLMMKSGDPMMGSGRLFKGAGNLDMVSFLKFNKMMCF